MGSVSFPVPARVLSYGCAPPPPTHPPTYAPPAVRTAQDRARVLELMKTGDPEMLLAARAHFQTSVKDGGGEECRIAASRGVGVFIWVGSRVGFMV